ncbi:hypothetical protein ACHAQA_007187 [Verticillium albo-atrum]
MAHHNHQHLHVARDHNIWKDVEDAWNDINPFSSDEDDESGRNGSRDENEEETTRRSGGEQQPKAVKRKTGLLGEDTAGTNLTTGTTIIRTVIQTLPADFEGSVASYRTIVDDDEERTTTKASPTTIQGAGSPLRPEPKSSASAASTEATTTRDSDAKTTTTIPTVISEPTKTDIPTTLAMASDAPESITQPSRAINAGHITSASSTPSGSALPQETASTEPSGAAKAGIAIGVLAGVLLIGLAVFFLFTRRKRQVERQRLNDDDEKLHNPFAPPTTAAAVATSERSNPRAPRISLRPVTQFLPNLNFDKRASKGANIAMAPAAGGLTPSQSGQSGFSAWDRPSTSESTHPNNPFGNQAERVPTPIAEEPWTPVSDKPLPPGPIPQPPTVSAPPEDSWSAHAPAAVAGAALAAGAVGAGGLARKASTRKGGPKDLDLTLPAPLSIVPPSPAGTEFSMNSENPDQPNPPGSAGAAAIAAAGGPTNSTVHRVQLDFKPTLEDEMGLRAGEVVRLLHEYDDGWALCIRLDRSSQGVVPRTCLSTRPVKPRPQNGGPRGPPIKVGPPRGPGPNHPPGQRPMPPQGGPRGAPRPMGPPGGRPMSPAGARGMSPGPRSQSPGPRFQGSPGGRSQSPNGMGRTQSPAGSNRIPHPSRMNPNSPPRDSQLSQGPPTGPVGRKPVPGQAY